MYLDSICLFRIDLSQPLSSSVSYSGLQYNYVAWVAGVAGGKCVSVKPSLRYSMDQLQMLSATMLQGDQHPCIRKVAQALQGFRRCQSCHIGQAPSTRARKKWQCSLSVVWVRQQVLWGMLTKQANLPAGKISIVKTVSQRVASTFFLSVLAAFSCVLRCFDLFVRIVWWRTIRFTRFTYPSWRNLLNSSHQPCSTKAQICHCGMLCWACEFAVGQATNSSSGHLRQGLRRPITLAIVSTDWSWGSFLTGRFHPAVLGFHVVSIKRKVLVYMNLSRSRKTPC